MSVNAKKIISKHWPLPLIPAAIWAGKGYFESGELNLPLFAMQILAGVLALFLILMPLESLRQRKGNQKG
ncbi:hypothetical protein [Massilia sp. BJB1822]|uniref:hypothetical protein n=1 Tax=Massilia sp. BJB1822 TaxID=2744470 RepID=UPI0015945DBF|nr:hypothetical protein [Massilia sp. BJB1822]NVE00537.1 hypothetical protein [Massilia sp. BJB1822]